jgi:hypothetical protein
MVLGVRFCILMGGGVGWEGWQNTQNIRANVERVAIIMSFQNSVLSTQYTHIPSYFPFAERRTLYFWRADSPHVGSDKLSNIKFLVASAECKQP